MCQKKLTEAVEIARIAHKGQVDKAGQPYFQHVQAVSEIVSKMILSWAEESDDFLVNAKIVSYLHDVLEDTSLTIEDLWDYKVPTDCILAVEILTKKSGQDYWNYVSGLKLNKLAAIVKIADMTHNSDLSRLGEVSADDLARREKYLKAIEFLSSLKCTKCGRSFSIKSMGEKSTRVNEILCKPCLAKYEVAYDDYEDWLKRDD